MQYRVVLPQALAKGAASIANARVSKMLRARTLKDATVAGASASLTEAEAVACQNDLWRRWARRGCDSDDEGKIRAEWAATIAAGGLGLDRRHSA
jgi:hypothetical protein